MDAKYLNRKFKLFTFMRCVLSSNKPPTDVAVQMYGVAEYYVILLCFQRMSVSTRSNEKNIYTIITKNLNIPYEYRATYYS